MNLLKFSGGEARSVVRVEQTHLVGNLCHSLEHVFPNKFAVFCEVVTILIPRRFATSASRSFRKQYVQIGEILHVDPMPDIVSFQR